MDYKTLYKESITNKEEFWKKQAERIVWDEGANADFRQF